MGDLKTFDRGRLSRSACVAALAATALFASTTAISQTPGAKAGATSDHILYLKCVYAGTDTTDLVKINLDNGSTDLDRVDRTTRSQPHRHGIITSLTDDEIMLEMEPYGGSSRTFTESWRINRVAGAFFVSEVITGSSPQWNEHGACSPAQPQF